MVGPPSSWSLRDREGRPPPLRDCTHSSRRRSPRPFCHLPHLATILEDGRGGRAPFRPRLERREMLFTITLLLFAVWRPGAVGAGDAGARHVPLRAARGDA